MDQFYQEIEALQQIAFNQVQLMESFQNHSIDEILGILQINGNNKIQLKTCINFIDALLHHPQIYKQIILSEKGFQFVQELLANKNKSVRELLSICIETHNYEFGYLISQLYEQKQPLLNVLLQVIFFQLSDPEAEVGLKSLRVIRKLFHQPNDSLKSLMKSELFITYLQQGIKSPNEVVQLRFIEILIYLSNQDEQTDYSKLFEVAFKLYQTDDVLLKLNMLEIMSAMGNSKWTASLLAQQPFFKEILNESFSQDADFFVRKYSVLLLAKMLNQRLIKTSTQMEKQIMKLLYSWLSNNQVEEIEGAMEVIMSFSQYCEGFKALIANRDFLTLYCRFNLSNKEEIKKKFLNSFIGFLTVDNVIPKPSGNVAWIFSQLGNNNVNQDFDIGQLNLSSEFVIKLLSSPFLDFEQIGISLLKESLNWEQIFNSFINNPKLKVYLQGYSPNKELFDSKQLIIQEIIYLCENKYKGKNYEAYANALKQMKQKEEMQYKTQYQ